MSVDDFWAAVVSGCPGRAERPAVCLFALSLPQSWVIVYDRVQKANFKDEYEYCTLRSVTSRTKKQYAYQTVL